MRSAVESGAPHGQIQALMFICEEVGLLGSEASRHRLIDSISATSSTPGSPPGIRRLGPTHESILIRFKGAAHAGCARRANQRDSAAAAISRMKLGRVDFETTANAGVISGGSARNVIPESCEVRAEARSRTGTAEQQVQSMWRPASRPRRRRGSLQLRGQARVSRLQASARMRRLPALHGRRRLPLGFTPDMVNHGGEATANILNGKGLPAAVIGVGYEEIHTAAEFISWTTGDARSLAGAGADIG